MTPTLSIRGLTQIFGETTALDDLTLTLETPGIHGLLGRNGSGKTTLMSIIAGLRRPTSGTASLNGMSVYENYQATTEICIIRESGDTTAEWSETITEAFALASDMRPYWDPDYAKRLLDLFELSEKMKVASLSRGKRAQLACTLGLAARAPLTLFDEAYLGMDAPSRYAFYDALLEDFMANPRLIVLSSHHIEEVARLFEEIVIIDSGRLVLHETADRLRGRGISLTGAATTVDALATGARLLSEKSLGPTKSVALYDAPQSLVADARRAGVEVGTLPIQDIFVHLTGKSERTAP
ncbi:ATP-binding cassette domain-containing protein [Pelagibacterium halotolerans]|uniref:ATP-binding cassette domain-containing protein n=1 Tax=Pelagibacterium halotolerans TaxID=531813 RepID=UPI00089858AA|nr:ABC transporter ATP-binding protein [Pelagibacterium halotolerans]QJR17782.1 ABC transporter ATP-binding protein [Pelagibacterium halotolerans]SEA38070.1 ABC-2 type transport system ATP-binding protein [Pelagibacterium halotolerans]